MVIEENAESFIDQRTCASGTLKTEGSVCIDGTVEGKVIAKQRVRVMKLGAIRGEIDAKEALIEGNIRGPIEASNVVILAESSNLESDVVAPNLRVQPGCTVKGYFIISPDADERERLKIKHSHDNSHTLKSVYFSISLPKAKKVQLIGDFIDWDENQAINLNASDKGVWSNRIKLKPGNYEYLFLVDDVPIIDPSNPQKAPNSFGGENSILKVK
jgi:cytoskeletal protein CcmA (bactofilin family)